MNDKPTGDDRSMNEILASIRKIVSDEERSRKTIDEAPDGDAPEVFLLTGDMRSEDSPPPISAPPPGAPSLGGAVETGASIGLSRLASALAPSSGADDEADAGKSDATSEAPAATTAKSPGPPPPLDLDGGSEPLDLGLVPRPARKAIDDDASGDAAAKADGDEAEGGPDGAKSGALSDDMEAMVRRIVREELKGPVGQQISRKVRALIREELAHMKNDADPLI